MDATTPLIQKQKETASEDELLETVDRRHFQSLSGIYFVGFLFQCLGAILVSFWALDGRVTDKFIGGLSAFTLHPLFMVWGFGVLTPAAISTWQLTTHSRAKKWHAILHGLTIAFTLVAITGIFIDHNYPKVGPPKANLYSAHAWVGLSFLVLFYTHTIVFSYVFLLKRMEAHRSKFVGYHRQIGTWILVVSNVILITGIIRKQSFMNCGYVVSAPDINPIEHYPEIPLGCKISNWAALSLLFGNLLTVLGLVKQ